MDLNLDQSVVLETRTKCKFVLLGEYGGQGTRNKQGMDLCFLLGG